VANLALAAVCLVLWTVLIHFHPLVGPAFKVANQLLIMMILLNVILLPMVLGIHLFAWPLAAVLHVLELIARVFGG